MKCSKVFRCLVLAIMLFFCSTVWGYDFEVDGIYYNISDATNRTVSVVSGDNSYAGDIVIPENVIINGEAYKISTIGISAFDGCVDLASVVIPNGVASISLFAFRYCI